VIQEFKDFINKGGVLQVAVGLVMALAFTPVVTSIVDEFLLPIVAAIVGEPDFSRIGVDIGDARLGIGIILENLFDFVAIAFVLFLVVKLYNQWANKPEDAPSGPSEVDLLTEIRDSLKTQ
jgi:large conductance mechanosensitive channel